MGVERVVRRWALRAFGSMRASRKRGALGVHSIWRSRRVLVLPAVVLAGTMTTALTGLALGGAFAGTPVTISLPSAATGPRSMSGGSGPHGQHDRAVSRVTRRDHSAPSAGHRSALGSSPTTPPGSSASGGASPSATLSGTAASGAGGLALPVRHGASGSYGASEPRSSETGAGSSGPSPAEGQPSSGGSGESSTGSSGGTGSSGTQPAKPAGASPGTCSGDPGACVATLPGSTGHRLVSVTVGAG